MNVKPGDLAYIKHPSIQTLWVVSVLSGTPANCMFMLPDGGIAYSPRDGIWLCESLHGQFDAPLLFGGTRRTQFAGIHDDYLRPLGDKPDAGETVLEIIEQLAPKRQLEHTR